MIVDFCVTPPHRDILLGMLEPLPHLAGYYDVYTMSPEIKRFIEDFKAGDFIAMMDAAGIDVAVLLGEDQETTFNKRVPNDIVAELARACRLMEAGAGATPVARSPEGAGKACTE